LVGWLPAAVVQALRAVRKHEPDVLYSTSKPETAHAAALIVHRLTGLPWVADFRDSWTHNIYDVKSSAESVRARATAALEQTVLQHATAVSVACESIHLPGLPSGDPKRVHIPNGVDPDDVPPVPPQTGERTDVFRLAHVGSLYASRDAGPVFTAIEQLVRDGRIDPARFEFRVIGHASIDAARIEALPVTFTGYVDHERALQEMMDASALLFYQPAAELGSSGKIFEYLASGRPIFCVAHPENVAYQIVDALRGGRCVDVRNQASITDALDRLTKQKAAVSPRVRIETLRRFSRRRLASELATTLSHSAGRRDDPSISELAEATPTTPSPLDQPLLSGVY
jgi:glycosyltransferase involved in cell wall biosynthesis